MMRRAALRLSALACKHSSIPTRALHVQAPAASGSPMSKLMSLGLGAGLLSCNVAYASASNVERSFIAIKPDGVHRGLISAIINRFEAKGYKLVGIKVIVPGMDLAKAHYAEHDGKPFFPKLTNFLTSGPVIAMVWEGKDVIKVGRSMIGATNPCASSPGTIRGDYGIDTGRNIIHGSDSPESAMREIALWFKPNEIADYDKCSKQWVYES